jgi:hypothetical protein
LQEYCENIVLNAYLFCPIIAWHLSHRPAGLGLASASSQRADSIRSQSAAVEARPAVKRTMPKPALVMPRGPPPPSRLKPQQPSSAAAQW